MNRLEWGYPKYFRAAESLEDYTSAEKEWVRREVARYYVLESEAEMCSDKVVVKETVEQNGEVSKEQKAGEKYMMEVRHTGCALEYASEEQKADRDFMMKAVMHKGYALEYASEELKTDKRVMTEAVMQEGDELEYTSEELKADKKFIMEVHKHKSCAFEYVSEKLEADKKLIAVADMRIGYEHEYVPEDMVYGAIRRKRRRGRLKADKRFIMEVHKHKCCAFECASEDQKADEEFMMEADMHKGYMLEDATEELKADKEQEDDSGVYTSTLSEYASEDLKVDGDFMEADMHKMLEYTSEEQEDDSGVYTSTLRRSLCRRRRPPSSTVVFVDVLQRSRRKTKKMFGGHRAGWLYTLICFAAVWWKVLHLELEADNGSVEETAKQYGGVQEHTSEELKADKVDMTENIMLRGRPREPD